MEVLAEAASLQPGGVAAGAVGGLEEGCQASREAAGSAASSLFGPQYLWSLCWVWALRGLPWALPQWSGRVFPLFWPSQSVWHSQGMDGPMLRLSGEQC